jgi:hypothetical protein
MPRYRKIEDVLRPLSERPIQAFFGEGLHTLGLLGWILGQTGKACVWVSSYSTSEAFLNGFCVLRRKGLVTGSLLLLDLRAARKTLRLERLMDGAFEHVFLGQNHSKVVLVSNGSVFVSVVTSQNQTYGDRAESTIITTDKGVFDVLLGQIETLCGEEAVEIDLHNGKGIITAGGGTGEAAADADADFRPFGIEW